MPSSCIFGIAPAGEGEGYPDDVVGQPIVYIAWNHSGSADDVERDTAGLRDGPEPLTATIGSAPYLEVQTAHDLAFAWGSRSFIKSHNANDVRPEALDEVVELVGAAPGDASFSITALGGAIGRVAEDATAYAGRAAAFDLSADSNWDDAADDEANIEWCRRAMAVVDPDRALGAYANGNSDAGPEETRRIFGDAKVARLAALKRTWDPDNVFHVNPNVTCRRGPTGLTNPSVPGSSGHRPRCEGAMTMKLMASMMLTVDGVYQGPGGPDEDRRGGFDRGGWTAAHADEEMWPLPDLDVRARGCAAARTQDLGDLGTVLAAPRRAAIRSPTASTSCPSTCPRPRSRTRPGRTPT